LAKRPHKKGEAVTTSNRRWFQFSIRGLFVLMLLVATYFAGFVTSQKLAEKARREAEAKAAAELEAAKATADLMKVRTMAIDVSGDVVIWNGEMSTQERVLTK
jgi:hypothetical protein